MPDYIISPYIFFIVAEYLTSEGTHKDKIIEPQNGIEWLGLEENLKTSWFKHPTVEMIATYLIRLLRAPSNLHH